MNRRRLSEGVRTVGVYMYNGSFDAITRAAGAGGRPVGRVRESIAREQEQRDDAIHRGLGELVFKAYGDENSPVSWQEVALLLHQLWQQTGSHPFRYGLWDPHKTDVINTLMQRPELMEPAPVAEPTEALPPLPVQGTRDDHERIIDLTVYDEPMRPISAQ